MKILVVWARSILLGWATLLAIAYGIERPLLYWTAPLFGSMWIATAHLALDCLAMAAAGFVAGRFHRSRALAVAIVLAVTLSFWDFGGAVALNVPLLLQLVWNSYHDSFYFGALLTSAETHAVLFGCLIAGAMLSRPRAKPVSIIDAMPR